MIDFARVARCCLLILFGGVIAAVAGVACDVGVASATGCSCAVILDAVASLEMDFWPLFTALFAFLTLR